MDFSLRSLAAVLNLGVTTQLTKTATLRRWEYCQSIDEPCCIESMVEALHDYVSDRSALEKSFGNSSAKIHLAGHGVSGIIALLYAQQYPEQIASLTLLSVAARPAVNWQAHYYALRQLLPCSRAMILAQMTRLLFGQQPARFTKALSQLLANDLDSNITLHSLAHHTQIAPGALRVPVLVCNGEVDAIAGPRDAGDWQRWRAHVLSSDDPSPETNPFPSEASRLWHCPGGNHFFHFYHAAEVAKMMRTHWQDTKQTAPSRCLSSVEQRSVSHRITQLA
ncbi:MAG: alpha/beta fold hydrolase [Phormidesmis sp.]